MAKKSNPNTIRLNKYISDTGFCSRREADQLIVDERVTVNGKLATMGTVVTFEDTIHLDGERLKYRNVAEENRILKEEADALAAPYRKDPFKRKQEFLERSSNSSHKSGIRGGERNKKVRKPRPQIKLDDNGNVVGDRPYIPRTAPQGGAKRPFKTSGKGKTTGAQPNPKAATSRGNHSTKKSR